MAVLPLMVKPVTAVVFYCRSPMAFCAQRLSKTRVKSCLSAMQWALLCSIAMMPSATILKLLSSRKWLHRALRSLHGGWYLRMIAVWVPLQSNPYRLLNRFLLPPAKLPIKRYLPQDFTWRAEKLRFN